jgi:hypothetical protein
MTAHIIIIAVPDGLYGGELFMDVRRAVMGQPLLLELCMAPPGELSFGPARPGLGQSSRCAWLWQAGLAWLGSGRVQLAAPASRLLPATSLRPTAVIDSSTGLILA